MWCCVACFPCNCFPCNWYNPPFNMAVKTKVGKKFLKLLETHFPKENKLHKILNRNTVKLSYSCMKNVKSIIQSHNAKIRNQEEKATAKKCTCRNKAKCPLQNDCNQKDVIYHATVEEGMRKKICRLRTELQEEVLWAH